MRPSRDEAERALRQLRKERLSAIKDCGQGTELASAQGSTASRDPRSLGFTLLCRLRRAVEEDRDPLRSARVAHIAQLLGEGNYVVEAKRVAEKIVDRTICDSLR